VKKRYLEILEEDKFKIPPDAKLKVMLVRGATAVRVARLLFTVVQILIVLGAIAII